MSWQIVLYARGMDEPSGYFMGPDMRVAFTTDRGRARHFETVEAALGVATWLSHEQPNIAKWLAVEPCEGWDAMDDEDVPPYVRIGRTRV